VQSNGCRLRSSTEYVEIGSRGDEEELRLMRHLMANYDNSVRPAKSPQTALEVSFNMALTQIIDVVSVVPQAAFVFGCSASLRARRNCRPRRVIGSSC
jgi:hypothetical protein